MRCSKCESSDSDVQLIPYYYMGEENFVCLECLPVFIHGPKAKCD